MSHPPTFGKTPAGKKYQIRPNADPAWCFWHNPHVEPSEQTKAKPVGPAVFENYRDYTPPPKTIESVKLLLRYVPPEHLVGLQSIVLTNIGAFNRKERRTKTWSRKRKIPLRRSLGWYSRATRNSPANIRLNIDQIEKSDVDWFRHVPLVRYYCLARTLYHEIGHHIHAAHRPAYEGRENAAEDWQRKLWRRSARTRYPYLMPAVWLLRLVMLPVARRTLRGKIPDNDAIFRK